MAVFVTRLESDPHGMGTTGQQVSRDSFPRQIFHRSSDTATSALSHVLQAASDVYATVGVSTTVGAMVGG